MLVLSYFNYCPIVWHFCGKDDIHKIENIHKRAIRFMTNDYVSDYAKLLADEDECTLYLKSIKLIAQEVFKSLNCLNPGYACEILRDRPSHYPTRYIRTKSQSNKIWIQKLHVLGSHYMEQSRNR